MEWLNQELDYHVSGDINNDILFVILCINSFFHRQIIGKSIS